MNLNTIPYGPNPAKDMLYSSGTKTLETIQDLVTIIGKENINISMIKDPETYIVLCLHLNIIPTDPENLFRYIIMKVTGSPVLIKSKKVITLIQNSDVNVNKLLTTYSESLSTVFHRFKPLFLALKPLHASQINRISKLAKHHNNDRVNLPLNDIKHHSLSAVYQTLNNTTTNTLLKVYKHITHPKLYFIRNGSMWCDTEHGNKYIAIMNALQSRLRSRIFKIEKGVDPAIPTSEKLFVGHYPVGTSIDVQPPFSITIQGQSLNIECIDPYNNYPTTYVNTINITHPINTPKVIICNTDHPNTYVKTYMVISVPYKVIPFEMTSMQKVIGVVYPDKFVLIDRKFGDKPIPPWSPVFKSLLLSCQPQKTMRTMTSELNLYVEDVNRCITKSEYIKMLR